MVKEKAGRMMQRFGRTRQQVSFTCSFCGKSQAQVEQLIAGPGGVFICDECVVLCQQIIQERRAGSPD